VVLEQFSTASDDSQAFLSKKEALSILIIHPDAALRDQCSTLLLSAGHAPESTEDGTEGIKKVYQLIPDVIVTTNAMPGFNGYQVCRLIKNDPVLKKIPVILIVDQYPNIDRFWAMKSGVDDFIYKESIATDLLNVVRSAIEVYGRTSQAQKNTFLTDQQKNPFNVRVRLNQILDQSLMESILMAEFRSFTDLVHDVSLLNYMLFSFLESVLDYDVAAIFYHDHGKMPRHVTFHLSRKLTLTQKQLAILKDDFFARVVSDVTGLVTVELSEHSLVGDYCEEETVQPVFETAYYKHMMVDSKLIGTVAFYSFKPVNFDEIFPVRLLEHEFRLLMKLRHLFSRAESMATLDAITEVNNHPHFMTLLQREFKSAKRYNTTLTLAIMNVDNLHEVNTEWGHACGDALLKYVSTQLVNHFRGTDIIGRLAGKKLAVIMPQTSLEDGSQAISRIEKKLNEQSFIWETHGLQPSLSIGVATQDHAVLSVAQMIEQAELRRKHLQLNPPDDIAISPA
jgi:two-component system, cell cycle response regulator